MIQEQIYQQAYQMKFETILITICMLTGLTIQQQCQNNGIYSPEHQMCKCSQNYIGKTCNAPAYKLKQQQMNLLLSSNFSHTYFTSERPDLLRFVLQFCTSDPKIALYLTVFAQKQKEDGEIRLQPTESRQQLQIFLGGIRSCARIFSALDFTKTKKANGQSIKIIYSFKLSDLSAEFQNASLLVSCKVDSLFQVLDTVNIFIRFFFGFVLAAIIIISIFFISQKITQRRRLGTQKKRHLQQINKIMPIFKYQQLVQDGSEFSNFDQTCAICLCQFQKKQQIRKTPCKHLYHGSCLDSWCQANLTCPICRKKFDQDQQLDQLQPNTEARANGLRAIIL